MFLTPQIIAEENKAFDPMDVFELEWASDPQVSSDGETIVYVRRSNDIMKDRVRSNLWRINTSGKITDHFTLVLKIHIRQDGLQIIQR